MQNKYKLPAKRERTKEKNLAVVSMIFIYKFIKEKNHSKKKDEPRIS